MTSQPIDIRVTLTLCPEGEAPETICEQGKQLCRDGKILLQFGERRIQMEKDRLLIRQGYTLELNKNKETDLLYPTPCGTLSMKVKTKTLTVMSDGAEAKYALYTNGQLIHYIAMKLKTERI